MQCEIRMTSLTSVATMARGGIRESVVVEVHPSEDPHCEVWYDDPDTNELPEPFKTIGELPFVTIAVSHSPGCGRKTSLRGRRLKVC